MAQSQHEEDNSIPPPRPAGTSMTRRKMITFRRRKVPTIRLGNRKNKAGGGMLVRRMLRKAKLKWLKLKQWGMLMKLKEYYRKMISELIEASVALENVQQRVYFI
ncbi:hypothetical protein ACFE04_021678 [Oxalis oulophora]